jgi:putative glutamine amidotransferase
MRPRIAISCGLYDEKEKRIRPSVTYAECVWRSGGTPMYMPAAWSDRDWVDEVLAVADGIVLTGGGDVDPRYFGDEEKTPLRYPSSLRDGIESRLVLAASDRGVPLLGICRGCQLINVAFGGTLLQDVSSMRPSDVAHSLEASPETEHRPVHEVSLAAGSKTAAAYRSERIDVNSMHHQAVDDVATGLTAAAVAPDGLVEGVEAVDAWVVGVQWHPERMAHEHPEHLALFAALVEAVARKVGSAA